MSVDMVVIGDREVFLKLKGSREVISEEIYKAMLESTLWLEASAKLFVPKRTGALAKAIKGNVHHYPTEWQGTISVSESTPYGPWVEFGTGVFGKHHNPYVGRAIGNYPTQRVPPKPPPRVETTYLHPGMRPRPYVRPALAVNQNKIEVRFRQVGHRVAERLN